MSGGTRFSTDGSSRNRPARVGTFELSTWLDAPVEAVFAFHENPRNLEKITPAALRVIRIEAEPRARVGAGFRIVVSPLGFSIDWQGEWRVVEPPDFGSPSARLVDGVVRAPFARFDHEHRFWGEGGRTRMTDHVCFALVGAGWGPLGAVANFFARWMVLAPMFHLRHVATRRFFARQ